MDQVDDPLKQQQLLRRQSQAGADNDARVLMPSLVELTIVERVHCA
jgi:hypothetical protein